MGRFAWGALDDPSKRMGSLTSRNALRYRFQALIGAASAIVIAGVSICQALPAGASPYPFCFPDDNEDCYFLYSVNDEVFPIAAGDDARVIAKGKEACKQMLAYNGSDPFANYAASFGGDPAVRRKANLFAQISAMAYCYSVMERY